MKKIILLSLLTASVLMADPLVSYPGTKAKGMGGAFTAIANNNSAMYFNPAGMVDFDSTKDRTIFTAEVGTGGAFDVSSTSTEPVSSTFNYFVAAGITNPGYGLGIAVYSLYSITANVKDPNDSTRYITKDQDISALSVSAAYALTNQMYPWGGAISVGATIGMAFSGGGLINYETTDEDGTVSNNYDDSTLDQRGFFGAVGIKARVYKSMTFNVDLGANYRSAASLDSVHDSSNSTTAPVNGMDMPSEIAYGMAAMYLTEHGVFTVSVDKKTTGYKESTSPSNSDMIFGLNDYDTLAFGVDFSSPIFQLRGGLYESTEVVDGVNSNTLNISGYTVGAGYVFTKEINIELSLDNKTYEFQNRDDKSELFGSLSLNFAFEN